MEPFPPPLLSRAVETAPAAVLVDLATVSADAVAAAESSVTTSADSVASSAASIAAAPLSEIFLLGASQALNPSSLPPSISSGALGSAIFNTTVCVLLVWPWTCTQ